MLSLTTVLVLVCSATQITCKPTTTNKPIQNVLRCKQPVQTIPSEKRTHWSLLGLDVWSHSNDYIDIRVQDQQQEARVRSLYKHCQVFIENVYRHAATIRSAKKGNELVVPDPFFADYQVILHIFRLRHAVLTGLFLEL
jgi:hypothetical protein